MDSTRSPHTPVSQVFTQIMGEMEVRPRERSHMSLGFMGKKAPKGFSVEVNHDAHNFVATQISTLNVDGERELVLTVTNHSNKTVSVEVRGF